jgi:antitoxin component HigA of HigAB toxin-antitoxin module
MSNNFLDSVLNILPAIQAKQINNVLNELKNVGKIRNPQEYSNQLKELTQTVNDSVSKPMFNHIFASIWYLCSSEAHNYMMRSAKNDIEAIYSQLDEINKKIDDHHFAIIKSIASNIEKGLNDQEKMIKQLKWLIDSNNEFSHVLTNTFSSGSSLQVTRNDLESTGLFFDNRTYTDKTINKLPNAIINENLKQLTLDHNNAPIYPLSVIKLNDEYSYGTELDVDNTLINNLIDGSIGTYWSNNIYLSDPVEKVNTVLEFSLGSGKDINAITIETGNEFPVYITNIKGKRIDNSIIDLSTNEIEIENKKQINFNRVFLKSFIITFTSYTYIKENYYTDINSELNNLDNLDSLYEKSNIISSISSEVLNNKSLSDLCNLEKKPKSQINYFKYSLVLDNVWANNFEYNDLGLFVSKKLNVTNPGILAVSSDEIIETDNLSNSIEYEIIKRDKFPHYKENKFPIPRINQTEVISERLVLIRKEDRSDIKDSGFLRFCPYVPEDWSYGDDSPIHVYENGVELSLGDSSNGFEYSINNEETSSGQPKLKWLSNNWIEASTFSNYKFTPQKMWIKLLNPKPTSVYTVSYKIRISDESEISNTVWLDKEKTIFLSNNSKVNFYRDDLNIDIDSDIYLQITLRRNILSPSTSPIINEYTVLSASYKSI